MNRPLAALAIVAVAALGLTACSAGQATRTPSADAGVSSAPPEDTAAPEPPAPQEPDAPSLTPSQEAAVRAAESYLQFKGFSRQGLIDQLSSEFADQFPVEDATIAVDSLDVDWNEQAVRSAESYLDLMGFSCQGLIDQLSSEFADKFTVEQATYAAQQVGLC